MTRRATAGVGHAVHAVVVGGGPAGAFSALLLARLGWQVLLVERGERNRHKSCGHCLSLRALPMLSRAGLLGAVREIAAGSTERFVLHGVHAGMIETPIRSAASEDRCLLVPRDRFDQLLRDAAGDAGVCVMHAARALARVIDDDGAVVRITRQDESFDVRCRLLIGADGVGSGVARAAGFVSPGAAGRKYGFSFDVTAPSPCDAECAKSPPAIDMFLVPGGYVGVVRQDDGTWHVGALVSSAASSETRSPIDFVRSAAAQHPKLRAIGLGSVQHGDTQNFMAAGPMPWRPRRIAAGSVALVGDAAGYVEPFTGEGIACALCSATALAESISRCDGEWNARAAAEYASLQRQRVQRRQRLCTVFATAVERPAVSRWMLRLGRAAPSLARRIARQVVQS